MNVVARKIWSGAVLLIIGTAFAYIKGDIPTNYGTFLQMIYFGFVLGNGFEHYTNMKIAQTQNGGDDKQ